MHKTSNRNLILATDSYKLSHHVQYPRGTESVYSYFEARVGARFDSTVFVGLQHLIKEYLAGVVVDQDDIEEAAELAALHFGTPEIFHRAGWEHIVREHGGRLPVRIRAVAEGTPVPVSNVLMTVENTDPAAFWLTNFLETLLTHVWYPSTVSSLSRAVKQVLRGHVERTGGDADALLPFMLHDFGCRGAAGMEAAALGGLGHLVNFQGTDTLPAIALARSSYGAKSMPAFSVPASEHSTMTSWGEAGEVEAYRNMLQSYPNGIVSVVSDSWDLLRAIGELWGKELKGEVLAREGRLVIRPDSGDPIQTNLAAVRLIAERFGSEQTSSGHKRLHDSVRILQGDGMRLESIDALLTAAAAEGWAAENWVFGMGGGLLQAGVHRDVQRFAFKASSAVVNGERREVFKRPATDPTKNSKRGRLALVRSGDGTYGTIPEAELGERKNLLEPVFENGELLRDQAWEDVVERAR